MKTILKVLLLLFIMNSFTFCTAEDLNDQDNETLTEDFQATGGDDSGEVDNDRDDDDDNG